METDHFFDSSDGLRLYCRIHAADSAAIGADALPVLCLPGLTRNGRDFEALAVHLRPRRQVLCADLRGRGRSAWDPDPSRYHLSVYVQDAWALLDSCAIRQVLVVGTSLGALMGMAMGADKPDRIAGVVLNDAGPEIDPVGLRRIAAYVGKLPAVTSWAEAVAQTQSVYGAALPDLDDAGWLAYARRGYREDASGVPVPDCDPAIGTAFRTASTAPADLWPVYARIREVPLLVIRGALSDLLSAATVARMAREKSDLQQVTVANRGHTPLLDEPESLAAIDAFVARYGHRTAASLPHGVPPVDR
jgi:pimeloyl-ACP methyl ester carboxylesterase